MYFISLYHMRCLVLTTPSKQPHLSIGTVCSECAKWTCDTSVAISYFYETRSENVLKFAVYKLISFNYI